MEVSLQCYAQLRPNPVCAAYEDRVPESSSLEVKDSPEPTKLSVSACASGGPDEGLNLFN